MHEEFLAALEKSPNDNVTRLVYADWLDEQGDPLAEFLRLEVRLKTDDLSDGDRQTMTNRLAELGRRAEPRWLCTINRSPFVWCALRKGSGSDPRTGKLELANYATRALLITIDANDLQYLRLIVTDPLGAVTDAWYGRFPVHAGGARTRQIDAANKLTLTVNLLNTVPVAEVTVGTYTVEAVYDYDGVQSRADPVRVELTDEDRRKWKLGRYARESGLR
ncbi:MAG: TIGR02996 domain-containing protein [Planctomycetes bacterium]|nr:TIGR02996 domain-containing protein [Planctomycetota bacterium]